MDNLLKEFSLLGIASLAVGIVVIGALIRKALELFIPSLKKIEVKNSSQKATAFPNKWSKFYNELGLYLLPYMIGAGLAAIKTSFVFGTIDTYGGRLVFSLLVASFSGLFYKALKKYIPGLFGVQVEADDAVLSVPAKG